MRPAQAVCFNTAFLRTLSLSVLLLLAVGFLLSGQEERAWERVRSGYPVLHRAPLEASLNEGFILGLLGGVRAIVADFVWIKAYISWEKRDQAATEALIYLSTRLDPRAGFFWIQGARIMAYDIPIWRIQERGGFRGTAAKEWRRQVFREQAEKALKLLNEARAVHPANPALVTEQAILYLNKLGDRAAAAEHFRQAYEMPGGPYFAARIHGELLRQQEREEEAYRWYCNLYRELPDGAPEAQKPVVLERIRELEETLGITPAKRFSQ